MTQTQLPVAFGGGLSKAISHLGFEKVFPSVIGFVAFFDFIIPIIIFLFIVTNFLRNKMFKANLEKCHDLKSLFLNTSPDSREFQGKEMLLINAASRICLDVQVRRQARARTDL